MAEDLCIGVLRDLSVPIKDGTRGLQNISINSTSKRFRRDDGGIDDLEDKQQHREFSRNKSGVALLAGLAAGLHHNVSSGGAAKTHERVCGPTSAYRLYVWLDSSAARSSKLPFMFQRRCANYAEIVRVILTVNVD